jgi:hypothetical protein
MSAFQGPDRQARRLDARARQRPVAYQALVVIAAIDPPGEAQDALQAAAGRAVALNGRGRTGAGCNALRR